jgi:hypothetical protein
MSNKLDVEIKDYSCPECGEKMERGYVTARDFIHWETDKKSGRFWLFGAEWLSTMGWFTNPKCPGLRCRKCGLVLFKQTSKRGTRLNLSDFVKRRINRKADPHTSE